jgi:hypothetical protein
MRPVRLIDQLAEVGIHGEDNPLFLMTHGQHLGIRHAPDHIACEDYVMTVVPKSTHDGDTYVDVNQKPK